MHFSRLEKLGFAALIAAWVVWGSAMLGDIVVQADAGDIEQLRVAGVEPTGAADAAEEPDFMTLLASADPARGKKVFAKCAGCHSIDAGGPHKAGPNLHDVAGSAKESKDGFGYSGALAAVGGTWGWEELNAFLESPKDYAPGNKMGFRGISKAADRAAVIAYLAEQSKNAPPKP